MVIATSTFQPAVVWALVRAQHGVVARCQLLELGLTAAAIRHRLDIGRLHPVHPGVYAVGRPELTRHGRWMAAILACGDGAALSHQAAAALWGISHTSLTDPIAVSVPLERRKKRSGIDLHRRAGLVMAETTTHQGIPVTTPTCTLVDLAATGADAEAAVNAADRLDLIAPETLRDDLERLSPVPGVAALRAILDRHTFTLTDSELERRFRPIARRAGLPSPLTQQRLNGYRVDFFWPDLGLVVETDGLRYHRTAARQTRDLERDQAHTAAGLTPLRFSRAQVRYEPEHVERVLRRTLRSLRVPPSPGRSAAS